jgi:branched-subunit amino acid ABC-type transport system permease component
MLMLRSAIQLIWGVEPLQYKAGIETPLVFFDEQLRILPRHIWMVAVTGGLVAALHLLLTRTRIGRAMRAVSDEPDLARVTGISTERVILVTWLIGGALAAVAGVFLGMDSKIDSYMGWDQLLPIFAAAILGGIGSPMGAAAGGLVLGLVQELSTYNWIGEDPLISPDYKLGLAFAIMVGLLIWRPTGLLRGRQF